MGIIFLTPIAVFSVPLSKYHDLTELEKDKEIATILEIRGKDQSILEVVLPARCDKMNSYLANNLHLGWENGMKISWKKAIPCQEGDVKWHKLRLPRPEGDEESKIVLIFEHVWYDWKTELLPPPAETAQNQK
jgi:hypothetical protein